MSATAALSIQEEIAAALGLSRLSTTDLARYTADEVAPAAVIEPENASAAAAILKIANEHGWTVVAVGSFSRGALGNIPERCDIVLRTSKMNSVLQYDPGDLTISVEAGVTYCALSRILAEHRQINRFLAVHAHDVILDLRGVARQADISHSH